MKDIFSALAQLIPISEWYPVQLGELLDAFTQLRVLKGCSQLTAPTLGLRLTIETLSSGLSFTDSISARMMLNISRSYIGMSGDEGASSETRELTSSLTRTFPLTRRCRAVIQPLICSSPASKVDFVGRSTNCFLGNWSILVSVGRMSGDWLVICVLGIALATPSAMEAELTDPVNSVALGLDSLSSSSRVVKKSRST